MRSPRRGGLAASLAVLSALTFALGGCVGQRHPLPLPVPAPRAMREVRPILGLALGGGGARGFAHIGALRVLEQEKIPIDLVVGTSVGSLVGALYADRGRVLDAELNAFEVETEQLFDYRALSLFSGGLVKGEKLESFLRERLRNQRIEGMTLGFAAVAVNLKTGQTVVFNRGDIAPAVHASCAIPGIFVPVEINGVTYVDGGVTDPVPSDIARNLGAEVVIAMAVPAPLPSNLPKNPLGIIHRAISIMSSEISRQRAREADVVITSGVGSVDYDDFSQKKRIIEAGEAAAREALPAIRAAIAAKTRWVPIDGPG